MTVAELSSRMGAREFVTWQILHGINPGGQTRDDWRSALMTAELVNMWRDKKSRPAKVSDFLLEFKDGDASQGTQGMQAMMMAVTVKSKGVIVGG